MEPKLRTIEVAQPDPAGPWAELEGFAMTAADGADLVVPSALRRACLEFVGLPLRDMHSAVELGRVTSAEVRDQPDGVPGIWVRAVIPWSRRQAIGRLPTRPAFSFGGGVTLAKNRERLKILTRADWRFLLREVGRLAPDFFPQAQKLYPNREAVRRAKEGKPLLSDSMRAALGGLKIVIKITPAEVSLVDEPHDRHCFIKNLTRYTMPTPIYPKYDQFSFLKAPMFDASNEYINVFTRAEIDQEMRNAGWLMTVREFWQSQAEGLVREPRAELRHSSSGCFGRLELTYEEYWKLHEETQARGGLNPYGQYGGAYL
jgi:hypothetical protein